MTTPTEELEANEGIAENERPGGGHAAAAWLFVLVGVALVLYGGYSMYDYSADNKIVGGDAYNYTIIATRGVGVICSGVASIAVAIAIATLGHLSLMREHLR